MLTNPSLCWCLVQILRPANPPAFAPSRHSGQECDFFGQAVHYAPRGARTVRMVAWGDCEATGGFSCRDAGQLHHARLAVEAVQRLRRGVG